MSFVNVRNDISGKYLSKNQENQYNIGSANNAQDVARLQRMVQNLTAENAKLKLNVQSLSSDLSTSNKEVDSIKTEFGRFVKKSLIEKQKSNQQRDSLSTKIADLNQELASLQNDLNISHGEKENIKAEVGKLIKKSLIEKQKSSQERDSLSAKIADLNQELASLQNDLNISRSEKDNIKAEVGKLIKKSLIEKQKSSQERDSLSAKIVDLNQELASLQNDLNISRGEKQNIKAEVGKLIKKSLIEKQKSSQERDSLSAKIADLNKELASLQNDLNISRGEKDNIKAELGKLIKKNLVQKQKSSQERDLLSAKIADLNQELVYVQQKLHEARQNSKQAHEDLQKTKCEKFELTKALNATTNWMCLMKTKAELQDKITKDCIEAKHFHSNGSLAPLDPEKNGAAQLESLISQNEITTHRNVKAVPTWRDKLYNFFYPSAQQ
ncbi:uncharacterized protein [Clytia hemisphaerica]|uniref:uncharacterized protein n=1 Tax=Clytia hemisphaerica TaxID=252671 RepID=UPI0034D3EE03